MKWDDRQQTTQRDPELLVDTHTGTAVCMHTYVLRKIERGRYNTIINMIKDREGIYERIESGDRAGLVRINHKSRRTACRAKRRVNGNVLEDGGDHEERRIARCMCG